MELSMHRTFSKLILKFKSKLCKPKLVLLTWHNTAIARKSLYFYNELRLVSLCYTMLYSLIVAISICETFSKTYLHIFQSKLFVIKKTIQHQSKFNCFHKCLYYGFTKFTFADKLCHCITDRSKNGTIFQTGYYKSMIEVKKVPFYCISF